MPVTTQPMHDELSEVSTILWRERQLLDLLIFKLEEEQLVLAAGRTRWLAHATREVETVLSEIRRLELDRAVHVEALTRALQLGSMPSLRQLSEVAPAPWDALFAEHRRALLELAQEVDTLARSNRDMLSRGQQAAREALEHTFGEHGAEAEVQTYSAAGASRDLGEGYRLIDEAF